MKFIWYVKLYVCEVLMFLFIKIYEVAWKLYSKISKRQWKIYNSRNKCKSHNIVFGNPKLNQICGNICQGELEKFAAYYDKDPTTLKTVEREIDGQKQKVVIFENYKE